MFAGVSESDLLNRILISHDILCPAGLNFRCTDPKLRSIMESCWKKDPNERPDFNCLLENVLDLFKQQGIYFFILTSYNNIQMHRMFFLSAEVRTQSCDRRSVVMSRYG